MGRIRPITENFDDSWVGWWWLWSNSRSFRWSGVRFSVVLAVSLPSGIVTLLVGSSVPSNVQGKERSNGFRISGRLVNTALISDPFCLATCLSSS